MRYEPSYCSTDVAGETGRLPEESLWIAVIMQAVTDARSNSKKKELISKRADALKWFESEDFAHVCIRAGICPDYALKKIKRALQSDFQWRLPSGQGWRVRRRQATQEFCPPL